MYYSFLLVKYLQSDNDTTCVDRNIVPEYISVGFRLWKIVFDLQRGSFIAVCKIIRLREYVSIVRCSVHRYYNTLKYSSLLHSPFFTSIKIEFIESKNIKFNTCARNTYK